MSGDLYFDDRTADVDVFFRVLAQGAQFFDGGDVFQKRRIAFARQQRAFVVLENGDAFVHQAANGFGTEIGKLVALALHRLEARWIHHVARKIGEQFQGAAVVNLPDLVGVFDVHNEVADVVGSFHQVGKRVTVPGLAAVAARRDAEGGVEGGEVSEVILIDAILFVRTTVGGRRIFAGSSKGGGGEAQAAVVVRAFETVHDAESVCVAFNTEQVGALRVVVEAVKNARSIGAGEIVAHRLFAEVTKGRIADIVRQAGGSDDVANVGGMDTVRSEFGIFRDEAGADAAAETAPDAGDFQRMGESGADIVIFFQREDLGFVFHAAESGGKDEAVAVTLEIGADGRFRAGSLADAVSREELNPVHNGG